MASGSKAMESKAEDSMVVAAARAGKETIGLFLFCGSDTFCAVSPSQYVPIR